MLKETLNAKAPFFNSSWNTFYLLKDIKLILFMSGWFEIYLSYYIYGNIY